MKYILIIGLLLSCSKPSFTTSNELIITSEKCFVKYTIYRIVEHPTDSLQFQDSGIIDCNYSRVARHRIPVSRYLLLGEVDGNIVNLILEKKQSRLSLAL